MKCTYDPSGNVTAFAVGGPVPPQIIKQPLPQISAPGTIASFSVIVADSSGVTFQWKFNDADIQGANGDSLLLTNVSAANGGQYSVVAINSAGSVTSATATLIVGTNGNGSSLPLPLKLIASSELNGLISVSPMKLNYARGETVTIDATSLAPAALIGWTGDLSLGDLVSNTNPVSFVLDGNKTVRARFASALSVPAGLIAFWRGENDATDLVGGHNGVFFSGTSAVQPSVTPFGKVGGCFVFDGAIHVRIPDAVELRPSEMTAEAWVFPTLLSGDYPTIIARGSSTNDDDTWTLAIPNGVPQFWSSHVGSGMSKLEGPSAIPLNRWTHLAITFDGTTKYLYVNGIQVASQSRLGALVYDPSAIPVTIGSDWTSNASAHRFYGFVDEVALYNRALTMNELFDIYHADFTGRDVTKPYFTTGSPLPDVAPGGSYSQQLTTVLGAAPISFSLADGALPSGITLSSTGLIIGSPGSSGTFDFTLVATDALGRSSEQLYVLRVLRPITLPPDMVAWWRGEPGTDDTVHDTLGGHDGGFFRGNTAAGSSYTSSGKVGSAFAFDGTVYVRIPHSDSLTPSQVTVEAWIFPTLQSGDHQTVIARGSLTNDNDAWWMGVFNGKPRFWSQHTGSGGTLVEAPSPIPLNMWTHLAITFDGTTKGLYVNGIQVASQSGLGALVYDPGAVPVTLGSDLVTNASGQRFTGSIDEVSLYCRALVAEEILGIVSAGPAGKNTVGPYINSPSRLAEAIVGQAFLHTFTSILGTAPVKFGLSTSSTLPPGLMLDPTGLLSGVPTSAGSFVLVIQATDAMGLFSEQRFALQVFESVQIPSGAVGWWKAEGKAQDSVGANHGTLRNGASFGPGRVGQAFMLDGSTGCIEIPDAPALRSLSITFETWVAFDVISSLCVVMAKPLGAGTSDSYGLWLEGGNLKGAVCDTAGFGPILLTPFSPIPGRWYHLAYSFDDAAKQQALYIDGVLANSGSAPKSIAYDGQPLLLGRDTENGSPNFFLHGRIDEATLYSRPLSAMEIASIYTAGPAGKSL